MYLYIYIHTRKYMLIYYNFLKYILEAISGLFHIIIRLSKCWLLVITNPFNIHSLNFTQYF